MINDDVIKRVQESNDIVDVAQSYFGSSMRRSGSEYIAPCPFHNDKNPSMTISPTKQFYHCFVCEAHGSVISLVMHVEREEFPQAVRRLARLKGITIEDETPEERERYDTEKDLQKRAAWANKQAADLYQLNLQRDASKLAYFTARGWTEETIKAWGLGYATPTANQLRTHLATITPDKIEEATAAAETAALIGQRENDTGESSTYEFFRDRYTFPVHNSKGTIVGFGGRAAGDQKAKYLNTPGRSPIYDKSRTLYGLYQFTKSNLHGVPIILCEGYADTIAIHQAGHPNTVATCGTALTEDHIKILSRYTDTVLLCFDTDQAGQDATEKAARLCIAAGLIVKVMVSDATEAKDPAELLQKENGQAIFQSWIDHAITGWEYLLAKHATPAKQPDEKASAVKTLIAIIETHPEEIARSEMLKDVARITGVGMKAVKDAARSKRSSSGSETARLPGSGDSALANYSEFDDARHISEIRKDILNQRGGDMGSIGKNLFVVRAQKNNVGHVVQFLSDHNALFAWAHDVYPSIRWKTTGLDPNGNNYVTTTQFHESVVNHVPAYMGVSAYPYEPPAPEVFTRWDHPDYTPTGEYLKTFCTFFNPATETDGSLIEAMILTMVWGGVAGQRPLFLICPESDGSQQAIGKSTMVAKCASLVGGHMAMDLPKRGSFADGLSKQAMEEINLSYRVAILDNITGTLRDDTLTQIITAPKISARASFAKQAERSNRITWIITTNEPNLSTDISSRTVLIRLAPCDRNARPNWEQEITDFIEDHRDHILADCIWRLQQPKAETTTHTRNSTWDNQVLSRLPNADALVRHIRREQTAADRDVEEIHDFLYELADAHPVAPGNEIALKLSDLAKVWGEINPKSKLSNQQISQIMKNALSRGNMNGRSGAPVLVHRKRNGRKVWLWRAWDLDIDTTENGESPGVPAQPEEDGFDDF